MVNIVEISASQNNFCHHCGHKMARHEHVIYEPVPWWAITKDHRVPRIRNGATTPENIVAACCLCNTLRGELDERAFKGLIEKWFKQDPYLWIRWHNISREEYWHLKEKTLLVHERYLRGVARRHQDFAYLHLAFLLRERRLFAEQLT